MIIKNTAGNLIEFLNLKKHIIDNGDENYLVIVNLDECNTEVEIKVGTETLNTKNLNDRFRMTKLYSQMCFITITKASILIPEMELFSKSQLFKSSSAVSTAL